jgi:hypothetical protein
MSLSLVLILLFSSLRHLVNMQTASKDSTKENVTLGETMKHIEGEDNTWREDITLDRALRRYVFPRDMYLY